MLQTAGDNYLFTGKIVLAVTTLVIFAMMYLWATTTHLIFMLVGLSMLIVQVSSFMYFSAKYIDTEYEEEKEKLR